MFTRVFSGLVSLLLLAAFGPAAIAQPTIVKQPQDIIGIALGEEAVFVVEVEDGDKAEYQWRLNGMNLPGQTDARLTLPKISAAQGGSYSVAIVTEKGSTNSEPALLVPELRKVFGIDDFDKAFPIDQRNEFDPLSGILLTDNKEATVQQGEPQHAGRKGGASIWFRWTAPKGGVAQFTVRGSGFDTLMAAYVGDSFGKLSPVSKTAVDDDRGGFFTSLIRFNTVEGQEYMIAIDGFEAARGFIILQWQFNDSFRIPEIFLEPRNQVVGPEDQVRMDVDYEGGSAKWFRQGFPTEITGKSFVIDKMKEEFVGRYFVEITDGDKGTVRTVPANIQINLNDDKTDTNSFAHDKFLMAANGRGEGGEQNPKKGVSASAGPSRGYTTTQIFSTVGSTKDPGEPNHAGVPGGASEWYVYSPPEGGTVHVNTEGSSYDTVVAVYRGGGFGYSSLIPVVATNNPGVNGQDNVRFTGNSSVAYFIAVDGVGAATGSVKLNIHLGSAPVVTSSVQSKTVGIGTNATFNVAASGVPAVKYQWKYGGSPIAGATNSAYTVSGATLDKGGIYSVTVSNTINTTTIDNLLTVVAPPTISTQPVSQTVPAGQTALFSVLANGSAPLRYQWRFNGTNVVNGTTSALSLTNVQASHVGQYSVVITNDAGSVTSSNASLTLGNVAPLILSHPATQTVSPNATVTLSVSASGSPAPTFIWRRNGVTLGGQTTSSLVISNFQAGNEGLYVAVATNSVGTATSNPARLALNSPLRTDTFTLSDDGRFELNLIGEPGASYVLQATSDLVEWTGIMTNSSPSGFLIMTDTNTVGVPNRYYRLIKQ